MHAARKVVGVGSVGTRCYILLFTGRDNDDPLFLQVKEAQASVLEPYAGAQHVPASRAAGGDGAATDAGGDRHLPGLAADQGPGRGDPGLLRAPVPRLEGQRGRGTDTVPAPAHYARFCGATLARAHARWGDRIAIASYLGQGDIFDRAIAEFSAAYADQNERDYQAFAAAVNSGRLIAQNGV